jgi:hypothetical protein
VAAAAAVWWWQSASLGIGVARRRRYERERRKEEGGRLGRVGGLHEAGPSRGPGPREEGAVGLRGKD